MSYTSTYKQFLASPDASLLAVDSTLQYVTTLTTFKGPADIIKHINSLRNQLKKKKEECMTVVEGNKGAAFEVETVIEFSTSGGPYLPGLDDNFVADRVISLPVTHFVSFDDHGKIATVRMGWDQGALLKQLDVIGKTGRNWPITDAKEQIKLISRSQMAVDANKGVAPARSSGDAPNTLRDPHASLSLFQPREVTEQETMETVISPKGRVATKPQRSLTDMWAGDDTESPTAGRERSPSPNKTTAPKGGMNTKISKSRIFNEEEDDRDEPEVVSKPRGPAYQAHPSKYDHFEFGAKDTKPGESTPSRSKHGSQWDFEDFVSPEKVQPTRTLKSNHQEVRHWGTDNDEMPNTPAAKTVPGKARRDADRHWELQDDGTPIVKQPPAVPRGTTHNNGLGLYKNNVYREEGERKSPGPDESNALGPITNLKNRGRDFQSHFALTDDSPVSGSGSKQDRQKENQSQDVNHLNRANRNPDFDQGISIGGDGMGGKSGTNRDWLFGDTDVVADKAVPGRKQGHDSGGFHWDF